jgi:hypothetical protein
VLAFGRADCSKPWWRDDGRVLFDRRRRPLERCRRARGADGIGSRRPSARTRKVRRGAVSFGVRAESPPRWKAALVTAAVHGRRRRAALARVFVRVLELAGDGGGRMRRRGRAVAGARSVRVVARASPPGGRLRMLRAAGRLGGLAGAAGPAGVAGAGDGGWAVLAWWKKATAQGYWRSNAAEIARRRSRAGEGSPVCGERRRAAWTPGAGAGTRWRGWACCCAQSCTVGRAGLAVPPRGSCWKRGRDGAGAAGSVAGRSPAAVPGPSP